MNLLHMADAAFAANIPPGYSIAAGYYGGPEAFHVWPRADWGRFPGYRLPIWVGGQDGPGEGKEAVAELRALRVPEQSFTVLDMETRRDITYVEHFGGVLQDAGYRVWVYGSKGNVALNPPLNGYWVAHYTPFTEQIMADLALPHVRAVQYATSPGFDSSLVKQWTEGGMWHG